MQKMSDKEEPTAESKKIRRLAKIISTSLDAETEDILSKVENVSEFVREAVKEKWYRMQTGQPLLSAPEQEFYERVLTFCMNKISPLHREKWFPKELTPELLAEIFAWTEKNIQQDLKQEPLKEYYEALRLVKKARSDKQYWDELYKKFRQYWQWEKRTSN